MKRGITLLFLCAFFVACQKFYPPNNNRQVSAHGENESHNNGQNCMNCHYQAGNGEGWFSVAGTVHGDYQNGFVDIFNNQGLVKSIEIDDLGNFYTTEELSFTEGELYVGVRDASGQSVNMGDPIPHGQCNLCHGTVIEDRIEI